MTLLTSQSDHISRTRPGGLALERPFRFTLIELLVVISIIAVLASMLLPALTRARDTTKEVACKSSERQLGLYIAMYRDDYDSFYPQSYFLRAGGSPSTIVGEWGAQIIPYIYAGMDTTELASSHVGSNVPSSDNFLFCPAVAYPGRNGLRNPSITSSNMEFRQYATFGYGFPGGSRLDWVGNYRISGFFGFWFSEDSTQGKIIRNCRPKKGTSDAIAPSNRILLGECDSRNVMGSTYYGYNHQAHQEMVIHRGSTSTNHLYADGHVDGYTKAPTMGLNRAMYPEIDFFADSEVPK